MRYREVEEQEMVLNEEGMAILEDEVNSGTVTEVPDMGPEESLEFFTSIL